jgi:outer membrane receptor protein involved in Fe transport
VIRARLIVVALLIAAPRLAFAVGEQNGRLKGTVTEASTKAPVPGATVTVSSPNLIGGPQVHTTADDGTYEFIELPPGRYDVEVGYEGVKPVHRRVVVRQGETLPLDIAWSAELTNVEETVVVEERHMTKPDSTQTGTVLAADTESKLATLRNYQNISLQVAGVSDPAGRGIPNIKGANRLQNRYLVDGMDVTDSVTNNFSSQVNFDAIGSVEVLTGGMEAQYNALGGVINLNTAAGTDKLHIDSSVYINNNNFGVGNQFGSQLYEHDLPFSTDPVPISQSYNVNLNVSGPLIKHKLWGSISLEYDYLESQIPIGPPLGVQHPPRQQHNFFPRLKLTYAPTQKDRLTLSANGDPAMVWNRAQTNSELGVAEYGQTQGGSFVVLQWDHFISDKLATNLQTGFNFNHVHTQAMGLWGNVDYGPMDPRYSAKNYMYDPNQPRHTNADDGSSWYNDAPASLDKRYTVQFDPSVSMRGKWLGHHDAKAGIQTRFVYHTYEQHTPGGSVYNESGGGPGEAGLCDPTSGMGCNKNTIRTDTPDFANNQWGAGLGFYIQDRWRPFKRLMILPGIRLDYGHTVNSVGQTVSDAWAVGPRLGFTLDLTGDQRTIFSAYYGRANDTLYLLPASRADVQALSTRYRWDPTQNGGAGGFVFLDQSGGPGGYLLRPNSTPPHTDEVTLGINREIFRNSVAAIAYTYKHVGNIWDAVEVNQIWDATGGRVVGYVNNTPQKVYLYTTPDGNWRTYHGIDFTFESRPNPHWDIYAAYTLSWLYGPGAEEVFTVGTAGDAYANPRQYKFYSGYLPEDQRHQFKLHASYEWHGLVVGANLSYASGSPLSRQYWNSTDAGYTNKRSPQGTDPGAAPNTITTPAQFRTPDIFMVNVRASWDMYELAHQHVILIVDLFNLFNADTPTTVENRDLPTFGYANKGRLTPFHFQLGVRYLF